MPQVLVTETYLNDIADAIRNKNGSNSTYTPAQMAAAIDALYPEPSGNIDITQNGTVDVKSKASAVVNVPNSYAAADEGKVVSSGALVTQTSRNITANGTYDTTENDEVVVAVPTGGGSSDAFMTFDFTKVTGTVRNVTYGSTGAIFDSTSDYIIMPLGKPDMTIEIDVAQMQLTSGYHRRFVMGTEDKGFIYRSTGVWAFYAGTWENFSETDGSLFDGSNVKIYVDATNKWHIYKDNVLLFEPTASLALDAGSGSDDMIWFIGSSGQQSINNAVISAVRLYDGYHA